MNHNDSNNDWIDQDDALTFLGVSRPTLYRWVKEGRLRAYRAGRALRFSRAELEAFVRGQAPPRDPLAQDLAEAIAFFEERARQRPITKRRKDR